MGLYTYKHPKKSKYIDIIQSMNDVHSYTDEEGVEWERVWTKPLMAVDSKIDPFSQKDFVAKTGAKRGTYNDLLETSKEMSIKRQEKTGRDEVREKYFENWSKTRGGKRQHPEQVKQELKNKLKNNKMIELED